MLAGYKTKEYTVSVGTEKKFATAVASYFQTVSTRHLISIVRFICYGIVVPYDYLSCCINCR